MVGGSSIEILLKMSDKTWIGQFEAYRMLILVCSREELIGKKAG